MAVHVCVTVSGPALSFLIYENVKSYCDQEGFLLGEIISHVTDTISDSQIRGEKMETLISINSLMPLPHPVSFYNGVGRVNQEKLKGFMKDKAKEVIGWYSFRRNSSLVPHLRDRLLHKELSAVTPHVSPEHFIMCLLHTSVSNAGSTHVFNHKFMRYRHSKFEALSMQIQNLGEIQPEYKLVPSTACLSESFNSIITGLKLKHDNGCDANLVCSMQRALQEHLRKLISDVDRSEQRVAELEREVETLRSQPGALPNEILLPQLMREDVKNIMKLEMCPTENILTPDKGRPVDNRLSGNDAQGRSPESGVDQPADHELFAAYVTEMKIEVSQPRGPSTSGVAVNNNRRERGRGRGVRRSPQPSPEVFPSLLRTESSGTSPVRPGQANSSSVKRRAGYSQAVKRSGTITETAAKPTTRSQASNGTNLPDY